MTGIERVGWPTAPRVASRPAPRSGFSCHPKQRGQARPTPAAPARATSFGHVALQEADVETVDNCQARKHGHDMLAAPGGAATGAARRRRR